MKMKWATGVTLPDSDTQVNHPARATNKAVEAVTKLETKLRTAVRRIIVS